MKKLLVVAGVALLMGACAESPTAPSAARRVPSAQPNRDEITCRSGYIVAYDENGNPYCAPADGAQSRSRPIPPAP